MKTISSSQNETFKQLKQLASGAKYRRRDGLTLLEGIHLCQSYLQHVGKPVMCVYTDESSENEEVRSLVAACPPDDVKRILVGAQHFKEISSVENGISVLFVVAIPSPEPPKQLTQNALLLEDIQDPGNMGAMLRTAAAAGVTEIYSTTNSTSAWSPKGLRAGMGAHFAISIYENSDILELIKNSTIPVLATSLEATESIYDKDLSQPTAWLLGNEGQGVSSEALALNVQKVIIPQNPNVESLNVAAATAVCLFEQARQQRQ